MPIINTLLRLATALTIGLVIALVIIYRLIWPILACLAMATLWVRGPQIAESLGNGLATKFSSYYNTDEFDHTTGQWRPDENGIWRKIKK